jgi:hypothetical protein
MIFTTTKHYRCGTLYRFVVLFWLYYVPFFAQYTVAQCPTNAISGKVFTDANLNGLDDESGAGVQGITVWIFEANNNTALANTQTNASGTYIFGALAANTKYRIEFGVPNTPPAGTARMMATPSGKGGSGNTIGRYLRCQSGRNGR